MIIVLHVGQCIVQANESFHLFLKRPHKKRTIEMMQFGDVVLMNKHENLQRERETERER